MLSVLWILLLYTTVFFSPIRLWWWDHIHYRPARSDPLGSPLHLYADGVHSVSLSFIIGSIICKREETQSLIIMHMWEVQIPNHLHTCPQKKKTKMDTSVDLFIYLFFSLYVLVGEGKGCLFLILFAVHWSFVSGSCGMDAGCVKVTMC